MGPQPLQPRFSPRNGVHHAIRGWDRARPRMCRYGQTARAAAPLAKDRRSLAIRLTRPLARRSRHIWMSRQWRLTRHRLPTISDVLRERDVFAAMTATAI